MVLFVFGDESADETRQRVFAVSGLMGTEDERPRAAARRTRVTRVRQ
jgi:hypothetical protein